MNEELAAYVDVRGTATMAALYERHSAAASRLAYLLTGDRGLAEDLVHEAFARVFGRLRHVRSADGFEPYLRRTIVNLTNSYFRRRAIERAWMEREAALPASGVPAVDLAAREEMRAALLALPPRQRAAVVLRYYHDLSDEQIAETLECRPATVRTLLMRGMHTLRAVFRGEIDEP